MAQRKWQTSLFAFLHPGLHNEQYRYKRAAWAQFRLRCRWYPQYKILSHGRCE